MYDKTSHLYDLLYEKGLRKDYATEAAMVASLVPDARTLLDVACGTGLHLQHLSQQFDCAGIDLDEGMLAIARERCPGVPLTVADMVDFDLGRTFDAVVCMFSSIGYARTEDRLRRSVATMAAHLNPGGTLVIEPWQQPESWIVGHTHMLIVDEPDLKLCRMSVSGQTDGCSVMEFAYLVGTPDGIEHLTETHTMGLFTWDQYQDALELAGLGDVVVQTGGGPMGRGLLIGRV